jgi:hypothetical protein
MLGSEFRRTDELTRDDADSIKLYCVSLKKASVSQCLRLSHKDNQCGPWQGTEIAMLYVLTWGGPRTGFLTLGMTDSGGLDHSLRREPPCFS